VGKWVCKTASDSSFRKFGREPGITYLFEICASGGRGVFALVIRFALLEPFVVCAQTLVPHAEAGSLNIGVV
jgi:hypothetical protein